MKNENKVSVNDLLKEMKEPKTMNPQEVGKQNLLYQLIQK
jgi:hypothetical protein